MFFGHKYPSNNETLKTQVKEAIETMLCFICERYVSIFAHFHQP